MFNFLKKKIIDFLLTSIILLVLLNDKILINGQGSLVTQEFNGGTTGGGTTGGGGEIINPKSSSLNMHEPSCEELRAMWRFSKRQSRASEITNEIPTYHDPFTYNIWEPYYPTTRSLGGRRLNSRFRDFPRPVYGRVLHKQPIQPQAVPLNYYGIPQQNLERIRPGYDDITSYIRNDNRPLDNRQSQSRKAGAKLRSMGGSPIGSIGGGLGSGGIGAAAIPLGSSGINANMLIPQKGSFQRLKELVWTERAKELQQQRKNEEMAVRAAILKDITNGQHFKASSSPSSRRYRQPQHLLEKSNKYGHDGKGMTRNGNSNRDDSRLLSYPSYMTSSLNDKRSGNHNEQSMGTQQQGQQLQQQDTQKLVKSTETDLDDTSNILNSNNNNAIGKNFNVANSGEDDVIYFDDDDLGGYLNADPYESSNNVNELFNKFNNDNINDYYYYLNQLLFNSNNAKTD